MADLLGITSDALTGVVLPGLDSVVGPFIGSVDTAVNSDTAAVYTLSGATITGTPTQTSLVVQGDSNSISSPAPAAKIVVNGSNNTVQATGAGAGLTVHGQNNHLSGSGGGDQFLLVGTGDETGNGFQNKFVLSTSPGATSGVTVSNFQSGSDQIDVGILTLQISDLIPSALISPSQFSVGSAASTPAQRFVYDQTPGNLFFDPDGSGPAQPTLIGHFTPGTAMAAQDIFVVNTA
jgi:hypothetical protein